MKQLELINYIKEWLQSNIDNPNETPEGLSEDSLNLLQKIEEYENE